MKETKVNSFSKATITFDEDTQTFNIEEITKEGSIENNLTDILMEWKDVEGISLTIKRDVVQE